jgi:hypothetical protein
MPTRDIPNPLADPALHLVVRLDPKEGRQERRARLKLSAVRVAQPAVVKACR